MRLGEGRVALLAAIVAIAGILALFLLSETAERATVAQALVAQENSLLILAGTARNCTAEKFSLCDTLCISVRGGGAVLFPLVSEGRRVVVEGRVKEYMGRRYVEAGRIELG